MILIIMILFCTENPVTISFSNLVSGYNKIAFLLLGVLPLFCMVGLYDNFLSFNLYSGRLKQLDICVGNKAAAKAYAPYFPHSRSCCDTKEVINANLRSLKEMNILVYPDERVFRDVMVKFEAKKPEAEATFCIYQYPYSQENIVHYKWFLRIQKFVKSDPSDSELAKQSPKDFVVAGIAFRRIIFIG